jgi:AraC-like DNA-binding protein
MEVSGKRKKVILVCLRKYLMDLRIAYACQMLSAGDQKVHMVARGCGFHTMAAFYRTIRAMAFAL